MSSRSRVLALLIGIDAYPHVGPLSGCVNDLNAMKAWLERSFDDVYQVVLKNDQATRANIFTALQNLAEDQNIQENDPVLIYFAGHGAEVKPLEEWNLPSKRKLQMLLPYDFKYTEDKSHQAGILDRDLSRAISEVAKKKENIIIILDACHSASGARGEGEKDSEGTERGVVLPDNYAKIASLVKTDFTADFTGKSDATRASSSTPTNHVLLAACREDLKTKECFVMDQGQYRTRGLFSHRLLERLGDIQILSSSVTYEELILSLGYKSPFPHCDGVNKDRYIFSMDRKDKVFQPIELVRDGEVGNGRHRIQLGLCHNIKGEDKFLIFMEKAFTAAAYVGEAEITDAGNFVSYLKVPPNTPNNAFAVRAILSPRVSISVPQSKQDGVERPPWFSRLGVNLVDASHEGPKLVLVQSEQDSIGFNYTPPCHGVVAKTFLHPSPGPLAESDCNRLIQHMGHFYDQLEYATSTLDQNPPVEIRLVTLDGNVPCDERVLNPDEVVKLTSCDEKEYGYKITNTSPHPIYFSLFYFDMCKFSIDVVYNPPTVTGGEASPCLEVGESKTIGYGNEGDERWSFVLEEADWTSELMRDALFLPQDQHEGHRGAIAGLKKRGSRKDGPHLYMPAGPPSQPIGTLKIPLSVVNGSE